MSHPADDAWLDDQLRETPLPDGLLDRLRGCLEISDQELDRRLAAVHVPARLSGRLREIPADLELDAAVATVAVPDEVLAALHEIAKVEVRPRRVSPVRQFVQTSLLTAAASLAFIAFMLNWVANSVPSWRRQVGEQIIVLHSPWTITVEPAETETQFVTTQMPEEILAVVREPTNWMARSEETPVVLADLAGPSSGPVEQLLASSADGGYGANMVVLRWGVLASGQRMEDDLPVIEHSDAPHAGGMQPPLVRGYNRAFWLRHRIQPPLRTDVAELKSVSPPVVTSVQSFERAEKAAASGALPQSSAIRPEEFLAATIRYPLPAPGQIGVHIAGGPSRYGSGGARLLQLGLQAGLPRVRAQKDTDLIVILDASASMARSGRWSAALQALATLPRFMSAEDRLTISAFTDGEVLTLEDLEGAGMRSALVSLANVRPTGSFDLPAALEFAANTALARKSDGAARRIAVITDDDNELPANLISQLQSLLETLRSRGVHVDITDMVGPAEPQPHLLALTEWSGGRAASARSGGEVAWSLAGSLHGQNPVLASEVSLMVEFDPRRIAAYRLIGHEGNAISSVMPATASADLRASEAATTMLEVWVAEPMATNGSYGDKAEGALATVKVQWKDAADSQRRSLVRPVTASDFHATFSDCPPTWQTAAIAAETAEMLRGSREALREIGMTQTRRSTAEELLNDLRRVPADSGTADERGRLLSLLDELRRRKLR